jgi:uncharacterized integral membrane protein
MSRRIRRRWWVAAGAALLLILVGVVLANGTFTLGEFSYVDESYEIPIIPPAK